jgi:hypothetical protein
MSNTYAASAGYKLVYPQTFYTDLNGLWLLARFGEMGCFGGLAPCFGPKEGRKNRVIA